MRKLKKSSCGKTLCFNIGGFHVFHVKRCGNVFFSTLKNSLENILVKVGSPHLYASFGTLCVQIGQKSLKMVKSLFLKENDVDFEFFRKSKI